MTKSTITREQAQQIIDAADEVITALAGTNDEVHKDDTDKMVRLWDDLNDRHAPPEVVRELARMALSAMDSEPVAYLVCNGRLYQDRAFMSPLMAEESVKNRNDGAEIKALCVCGKAECAE
ncbi:Uncharacterised protein [Klebsiella michiganensis]|nr:hypothetical protein [Klebsiella michiganensis]SAP46612.1 Uncharacterised protein [Klebsiella michiganensis]SBL66266.1 Uncharacterised protein [Klebsiella michiganensis]